MESDGTTDNEGNEWDAYADSWDQDAAARAYAAAAFESLHDVLRTHGSTLGGARALDFGCGTGLLSERLVAAGATVLGVDTSRKMLDVLDAKTAKQGWANVETSTELPTELASFDVVVCSSVCSFLDDYPATAKQLVALLQPGGAFVQWDWEADPGDADPHGLSRSEIVAALERAGLQAVEVRTGFTIDVEGQAMQPLMGHGRRP